MSALGSVDELRARLRAYVTHESESSRRSLLESWSLSVAERVDAGVCVAGLRFVGEAAGVLTLACSEEFSAKFREGDPLYLCDEVDCEGRVENGAAVNFAGYDVASRRLRVTADRFEMREPIRLDPAAIYSLDRRGLGLERLLLEGLDSVFHADNQVGLEALLGNVTTAVDGDRHAAGVARGHELGFTDSQCEALGRAVATEGLCLIQGPPGTGKTRVLAEAALFLAKRKARIFVTGFTHRAVNNVLLALRRLSPEIPIFKAGGRQHNEPLLAAGIRCESTLERLRLPAGGLVVGGTPFSARKRVAERCFHFVFLDEAGQMPVVHGAIAMTQARRWVVVGDPRQLAPVRVGGGRDELLDTSIHRYFERHTPSHLLDVTFRLNDQLTDFVSEDFYEGRLRSAPSASARRVPLRAAPPGDDPLAAVLDPAHSLVWARIDHEGRTRRSPEEVACVVDLVTALTKTHGIEPKDIAVMSPFRAQVRAVRYELEARGVFHRELVVDTIERMQGQQREVVILSLAASDRDYLERQAEFFFVPGRLNVAISRARTKCIVVASRHAFRARPIQLPQLLNVAHFKRLAQAAHTVHLSR